jgi:hypothetical protein
MTFACSQPPLTLQYVSGDQTRRQVCGLLSPLWVPCKEISTPISELFSFKITWKFLPTPLMELYISGKNLLREDGFLS